MILSKEKQNEIDLSINNMLASLGLDYPENSLLDIINALGIKVFITDFKERSHEISGIVNREKNPAEIYLNKNHPKERQTFTLAHELGHYILHDGVTKYRIDKYSYENNNPETSEETEANYFAASLLVPEDKLRLVMRETRNIEAIAEYFGVSSSVIKVRINWIRNGYKN